MRKLAILTSVLYLSGCATTDIYTRHPDQVRSIQGHTEQKLATMDNNTWVKTVATIIVVGAIAGAVGKQNQNSKCANNRAGFWQDHSTGKIYTCN